MLADDDPYLYEKPSKSERKRASLALQKLSEPLLTLKPAQLEELGLPTELLRALDETKRIPGDKAKKRQHLYLGKLIRQLDEETLERIKRKLERRH